MLSQREFNLLLLLKAQQSPTHQRQLAERLSCSLGTVNHLLQSFTEAGYYDGSQLTAAGLSALEPYRVRRAILLAAGFGARLVPITLNTPKALVRVNGKRIIDSLLDAIQTAGIQEIIIVRGYLGEQFDQLLPKYPQIRLVDNPLYNETNNLSSALCVKELFKNAYVMDADLILKNPALIRSYEYQSNLLGIPIDRSDDWCVTTDRNGFVNGMSVGAMNAYREVCISYWTTEDGAKLAEDLEVIYHSPGGKERFWEQVPLVYKKQNYHVALRECSPEDVIEIDTFSELKAIDKSYDI